jgi:hypothetical protein
MLSKNELIIQKPDSVELGSFINNKYVQELVIDTPIQYLKKHIKLDGIQFVDTPGPNSAANKDHKRITYNFLDKANVVIYVIDFTKFDIAGEDELLESIKQIRESVNPKFYEKFFFAINKIDMHEEYKGDLESKLNHIRKRIQEGYGYKVADNYIIGVAAKPALLYRLNEQKLLDAGRKKEFNGFIGRFMDFTEFTPKSLIEATSKVLALSNINALDDAIISYLQNSNQTRELILDAIKKAKMFLQNYEQTLKEKLGIFQVKLEQLEQKTKDLQIWIQDAVTEKDQVIEELETNKKALRAWIFREYDKFHQELKSIINTTFSDDDKSQPGLLGKLKSAATKILRLEKTDKSEITKTIEEYNKILTEATQDIYSKFEAKLKSIVESKRKDIYNKAYNTANKILSNLNQQVGETLKVEIVDRAIIFPSLVVDSVIDKIEKKVYKEKKKQKSFSEVTYYSVDVSKFKMETLKNIGSAVKNGKGEVMQLLDKDIKDMKKYLIENIDEHINKLRDNLNNAVQMRKTDGFNVQEEITKIESEIEQINEMTGKLDTFAQTTEKFKLK